MDGTEIHYTYDAAGNRTSKTKINNGYPTTVDYSFNKANQLKSMNGQAYEVDANGNLLNDGEFRYEWNAFDQLTKVSTIGGNHIAEHRYDDQGRRVYSNTFSGETYYRYNGTSNQVLFEEDASGDITKAYTYDDNGYPLTMTYQGETYYYLTNYRGDVLALVNESVEKVATYTYDAWGNILTQSGPMASENPYRYAGYRYDEETKLYYLMARYYNPDTGVFLSLDPVRGDTMNPITMNGYSYANNNPVMYVDPEGEFSVRTSVLIGAINVLIVSIPGLHAINKLIKLGKKVQVHKLLNGKKIVLRVELKEYFSRLGLKVALATTVASVIVNALLGAVNSSVGSIVAWALKKYFFKSFTIKAKKYIYWGPKVNVEYIDFGKRK